jgi:hypothetical protein
MSIRLVSVISGVVLIVAIWSSALATNFGSDDGWGTNPYNNVSLAQNQSHWIYRDSFLPSNLSSDILWAVNNLGTGSDIMLLDTAWQALADVRAWSWSWGIDYPPAWVNCPWSGTTSGSHPNMSCFGQDMHFNLSRTEFYDTQAERRFVVCHELGHTMGLKHRQSESGCMQQGNLTINQYTPHDIAHLNAAY